MLQVDLVVRSGASDWNSLGVITGSSNSASSDDHAFVTKCLVTPASTCDTAPKGSLLVKDDAEDSIDRLNWKWSGGSAMSQADFGDPTALNGYRLCVYDATAGVDHLVAALVIDSAEGWSSKDPKGWQYRDNAGGEDGVTKIQLKTGDDGEAGIQLFAKGDGLPTPTAYGATEFFDSDSRVTVQLVRDGSAQCWSSQFSQANRNSGAEYQAKAQ